MTKEMYNKAAEIDSEINRLDTLINYVEKGDESDTLMNPKPKFHEGDYIVPNDITFPETWRVINIDKDGYYNIQCITNPEYDEIYRVPGFVLEKDYHPWSINDARDGDVLATSAGAFIYNGNDGGGSCPGSYCGINTLGKFQTCTESHWTGKKVYPATKEQRDLFFSKMKEVGYDWDGKKKKLSYKHLSIMNFRKIIEQVEELSTDSYVRPHQMTIDTIEEVIEELRTDELLSQEAIIGSCLYKVNNLIEVMNPEYQYDIEVLTKLSKILESCND